MVRGTTVMSTNMTDETRIRLLFFGMIRPPAPGIDPFQKVSTELDVNTTSEPGSKSTKGGGK